MYILWPQAVRHAVLLSLYLLVCSASPSYHIVVPVDFIHGANTSFAVHWFVDSDLTVTAGIKDGITLLSNVTKVIKKDSIEIITLPGIVRNTSLSVFELSVNGSSQNTSVFSERTWIPMQIKNQSIFIQTDKTFYKSEDTVKIRIIAINYNLKPRTGDLDLIIRDPMYNIVQQRLNMKPVLGVISTQFQLANNPMLGEWIIEVKSNDEVLNIERFNVAENVFKKFEVNLDAPPFFIDSEKENLTGTVTAKYYYGKPVNGTVKITIRPFIAEVHTEVNKTYEISGSVNFSFTYEEIQNIMYWGGINITATVYEELTGIAVEAYFYVRRENTAYKINIISQNPMFEAGQKFTAQFQVQRIDNKPLTKEEREKNVSVKITQGSGDMIETSAIMERNNSADNVLWQNYTISESGNVNLEFSVAHSIPWIQLEVQFQNVVQMFYFQKPSTEYPFIQINISESSLKVGTPFHLQANTNPKAQDLYYVVIAKGMVVAAGKNKTTFSLTPEQSWAPSAQMIVYFLNLNGSVGDIIKTTQMLSIKGTLKNQVTLSWSKNSAKPLENVILSVNVMESLSLVGLRVAEKSPTLLGYRNDLTAMKVDNELFTYYRTYLTILSDAVIYNTNEVFNEKIVEERILPTQSMPEFIDTWIWQEVNISTSLSTNLQVTVPDKNTTWVATAFVISEGFGLGVTETPIELSVVKPLFMTLNMPNMLTRGEKCVLELMLINNLKEQLQVIVTLESSNSFDIIVPNNNTDYVAGQRNVTILGENGTVVFFPIQPKVLGNISITLTATSKAASDSLTRYIVVRAEGVTYYYSESALFDVRGSANATSSVSKNFSFTFPSDLVQGSEQAYVAVVGDLLAPSINGVESLIVLPYGCGEQTMINFAPNIYILLYLIATKQLTGIIREKSINFMEQGYQRELIYRHNDGSFSAFGNSDMSGSTWLTAFVFRCFLQARLFIYIDPVVLTQAADFLIVHQDPVTGVFSEPGRVIHKDLQGGLNGPVTLTSYIASSLLSNEYSRNRYATNIQKAVQYLEVKYDNGISSNYTLSVVAYALSLANSTRAQAALTQLYSRATVAANGETKYWSAPSESSESSNYYWQPRTTDIETAAYALLSCLLQNRIADCIPVMKWLSQQRNQFGGYASTQDTVMALQALSQFLAVLPFSETSLDLTVTGPSSFETKTFQINSNRLELQSKQIEVFQPLSFTVNANGYGLCLFQLNVIYNRVAPSRSRRNTVPEIFTLDLEVTEDANIFKMKLDVSMSYQGEDAETGMVIVECEFLNGFKLSDEGIPTNENIAFVEPDNNKVNIYLYSLTKDIVRVSVPMVRYASVAESQDATVRITDYYKPRKTVTRTYNSKTMKSITACDFCGFNCTQCRSNVEEEKTQTSRANMPTFFMLCISMVFLPYLFSQ